MAPAAQPAPARAVDGESVQLDGVFHIIWNTRPRYFLTDDAGTTRELMLQEERTRDLGGPLALNGRRVRISGQPAAEQPELLRVDQIRLLP